MIQIKRLYNDGAIIKDIFDQNEKTVTKLTIFFYVFSGYIRYLDLSVSIDTI